MRYSDAWLRFQGAKDEHIPRIRQAEDLLLGTGYRVVPDLSDSYKDSPPEWAKPKCQHCPDGGSLLTLWGDGGTHGHEPALWQCWACGGITASTRREGKTYREIEAEAEVAYQAAKDGQTSAKGETG